MKTILSLIAAAGMTGLTAITGTAKAQSAPAPEPPLRMRTSFDFVVRLPLAQAAPLFGPEGERAWAGKHWDPKFIYPQPAKDVEGAIFTIEHGPFSAVWLNTSFDVESRHFQYVYFIPGILVTVIDVRFKPIDAATTQVNVIYTRTAIAPEGNEHVQTMSANDKTSAKDWQQAIDAWLASSKAKP